MSNRTNRAETVSAAIEGENGWGRDPYTVPGAIPTWDHRFPNLALVADGREVTGFTNRGRGTTAFDMFRSVNDGGILRMDFLSLKTARIAPDGKLPSKIELSTGLDTTISALIEGIDAGASLPTLVWASEDDTEEGFAIFLDLAEVLRGGIVGIEDYPENGYGRGKAPAAYYKWSAARKCGDKGKWNARADDVFPYVDDKGRKWTAPDRVCYPELVISLAAIGIKRNAWVPVSLCDLASFVEQAPWADLS